MYQCCILQTYSIVLVSNRKISCVFLVFFPGDDSSPKQHRTGDAARVNTHSAAASGLITTFSKSSILIIKKLNLKTKTKTSTNWKKKKKSQGGSCLFGKWANVQKVGRKQVCWINSDLLDIRLLSHRIHMQHQRAVQGVAALVLLFRLPTVNLNLKSFQAKWNNENIPSSASEPLCNMYSQERKNAAQCQDRRDSGGDNASFFSASSSSGIGFTLKTDMFDSWGAANVFAASALFKREKGEKKKKCSIRYYISAACRWNRGIRFISSSVWNPSALRCDIRYPSACGKENLKRTCFQKKKKSPILILYWGLSGTLCYTEACVCCQVIRFYYCSKNTVKNKIHAKLKKLRCNKSA